MNINWCLVFGMVKVYNRLFYGVFVVNNVFVDVFGFDICYIFVLYIKYVSVVKQLLEDLNNECSVMNYVSMGLEEKQDVNIMWCNMV